MKKLKAIIFDLDDTLYLERDFVKSGFIAVSTYLSSHYHLNNNDSFDILWNMFCSGRRGDLFNELLNSFPEYDITVQDLIKVYRQHKPVIKPLKNVTQLLESHAKKQKLGLLSDGYFEVQKNKFVALGLQKYFSSVLFTDELGRNNWKPSIVPFKKILDTLNVNPNESVYIADNPEKDFKGPNQLGINTIRIRLKGGEHYNKKPQSADYSSMQTVFSIQELSEELDISI